MKQKCSVNSTSRPIRTKCFRLNLGLIISIKGEQNKIADPTEIFSENYFPRKTLTEDDTEKEILFSTNLKQFSSSGLDRNIRRVVKAK